MKRRAEIEKVFARGSRFSCKGMRIHVLPNELSNSRLVIAPVRSYPNAVARNRAKRVVRECWRLDRNRIASGYDVAVVLFPGFDTYEGRKAQLDRLLHQAGIVS